MLQLIDRWPISAKNISLNLIFATINHGVRSSILLTRTNFRRYLKCQLHLEFLIEKYKELKQKYDELSEKYNELVMRHQRIIEEFPKWNDKQESSTVSH